MNCLCEKSIIGAIGIGAANTLRRRKAMKVILSRKYKKDAMEIDIRAFESCLHGHPGARGYFVEDGRTDDGGEFTVVRFYWPPKGKSDEDTV